MKYRPAVTLTSIVMVFMGLRCGSVMVDEQSETIIFGKYYGYCVDRGCITMYRVCNGIAYKDTIEKLPSWTGPYESESFKELPTRLYGTAKTIYNIIPGEVRNDTTTVYGEPDAGDWGGFCIEIVSDGEIRYFLLDNKKENLTPDLHGFRDELDTLVHRLNELTILE